MNNRRAVILGSLLFVVICMILGGGISAIIYLVNDRYERPTATRLGELVEGRFATNLIWPDFAAQPNLVAGYNATATVDVRNSTITNLNGTLRLEYNGSTLDIPINLSSIQTNITTWEKERGITLTWLTFERLVTIPPGTICRLEIELTEAPAGLDSIWMRGLQSPKRLRHQISLEAAQPTNGIVLVHPPPQKEGEDKDQLGKVNF